MYPTATQCGIVPQGRSDMQAIIPDCSKLINIRDSDMLFYRNLDVLIFYTPIPVITSSYGFLCSFC